MAMVLWEWGNTIKKEIGFDIDDVTIDMEALSEQSKVPRGL